MRPTALDEGGGWRLFGVREKVGRLNLPCISRFFGIAIYMYHSDHVPLHFHAIYGEFDAEVEIATGKVIDGYIPKAAGNLVKEWTKEHRQELWRNWRLSRRQEPLNQVAPLE